MPSGFDLLSGGTSNELKNLLLSLEQIDDGDGGHRYTQRTVHYIRSAILGRAFHKLVHQLCYLTHACSAGNRPARLVSIAYAIRRVRGDAIIEALAAQPLPGGAVRDRMLICFQQDRKTYSLKGARIPRVICFLEFLIAALGWKDVESSLKPLCARSLSAREIDDLSNEFYRVIYRYLADHLHTSQSQRQFNQLLAFLKANGPDDTDAVGDRFILDFWITSNRPREMNGRDEAGDFKLYQTAATAVFHFLRAVEKTAETGPGTTRRIGADREAGEIDIADEDASHETFGLIPSEDLTRIAQTLSSKPLKVFTAKHTKTLAPILMAGDRINRFSRTPLRFNSFGEMQNRALKSADAIGVMGKSYPDAKDELTKIQAGLPTN